MWNNFVIVAGQVLILFILIFIGFVCGKNKLINKTSASSINDIVLYVVTPCVMISAFQREFSSKMLLNVLITAGCASLILLLSIFISKFSFRDKDIAKKKVLQFGTVFSNCGFMSLPLQKAILGDDGWFYGSIFVAIFNLFVWSYGLVDMSGDKKELSVKKLIFNPGIAGVTIAFILFVCKIALPYVIITPISYLADLNTPLPMLVIGFYLSQANIKRAFTNVGSYILMLLRLVVIPLGSIFLLSLLNVDRTIIISCVIASSAPTAATTTMFANKFNKDVELSVSVVSATTLLSIVTMPLIIAFAQSFC